ncbi:NAD-dependent epimerase/dehydratase family protein [uncultured Gimesia sp.]|uniref:NAD-dependent epimerase/dehydratase family protein n=1 Tax=uncultured Gimesia sp. TaxID=1678688 RepID=UPI0030D70B7F|tara:strand:- start:8287 stop:9573 length:1287 start_codon:yes stop_codon:yes gene_type:complete
MNILITGATGYIGKHLVQEALKEGHQLVLASRKKTKQNSAEWVPFNIKSAEALKLSTPIDVIIHLAANTNMDEEIDSNDEIRAAQMLLSVASQNSAKFIFISSQTASQSAPTEYGKTKWQIEQDVLAANEAVIRPGQVYGGKPSGLFSELINVVKKYPILPAFIPVPKIQPVHIDDLVIGILRIAEIRQKARGLYCLAAAKPIRFSTFLFAIAKYKLRVRRLFIPFPTFFITMLLRIVGGRTNIAPKLERLLSLFQLPEMKTSTSLNAIGLHLRPLHAGMHPSGNDNRRQLLLEGQALLIYVLNEKPQVSLVRRYVRSIEQLRLGTPLGLRNYLLKSPRLIAVFDESSFKKKPDYQEFFWRIDAVTILAEATPRGAFHFLALGRKAGLFFSALWIGITVLSELGWRVISLLFRFIPNSHRVCFQKEEA